MTSNQRLRTWRPQTGFTLIEVMITVAIVAILSMVAMPSYRDYVIRGNIPEATSRLATKQVQMEQSFQDNRTYVGGTGCTADTTSSKYFDFSCSAVTATTFTITAAGKGSMTGFSYTINQTGAKTTGAVPSGWSTPSPNTCWAIKKGGVC
jgi:type IV pilus assembly protein PilE